MVAASTGLVAGWSQDWKHNHDLDLCPRAVHLIFAGRCLRPRLVGKKAERARSSHSPVPSTVEAKALPEPLACSPLGLTGHFLVTGHSRNYKAGGNVGNGTGCSQGFSALALLSFRPGQYLL